MNRYPDKIQTIQERNRTPTVLDYGISPRKIKASYTSLASTSIEQEKQPCKETIENEIVKYCQALLLSTCVLLLSYHSLRYGRTEYSILDNGQVVPGYKHKAIVTFSLGYSVPYSLVSLLAVAMLAYSLLSKKPRWSLPSITLYLADLVYDISGAIIAIWLFFFKFPLSTALSYSTGSILFILAEMWIWLGVLRLYEHRTFK